MKTCPICHSSIPENSPAGLCPACVLRDADEAVADHAGAPALEAVALAFPKLEIMRLIGRGGMGFVYLARQPELDRMVALKILSPALRRDPAFEERFAREARVLGKLQHPNIVTIFEHGEAGGFFYLLMEYVDGLNLRQAMAAGRFTPEQALAIVPAVCDALQSAHTQGVWHRDIKPENILLGRDGQVKIADFGIARILGEPERNFTLTRTGVGLGSVAYMAPEQHEKPHEVDHRADIYSLGVVIYEMLTGELPLGRFPMPSQRAAVNAHIDEVVLRTLEKERELRQQSAAQVKTEVVGAGSAAARASEAAAVTSPRSYGKLAFGLFLTGILGTSLLAVLLGSLGVVKRVPGVALLVFAAAALLVALILGIMSWRERLGKFVVIATGVLLVLGLMMTFRSSTGLPDRARGMPVAQGMSGSSLSVTADPAERLHASETSEWPIDDTQLAEPLKVDENNDFSPWGSYIRDGDMRRARGDLDGAMKSYQAGLAFVANRQSKAPGTWLKKQSECLTRIGDVQCEQGSLLESLESYRASQSVLATLLEKTPEEVQVRNELTRVQVKMGDVMVATGDQAGAVRCYRDGVAVAEKLGKNWESEYPLNMSGDKIARAYSAEEVFRLVDKPDRESRRLSWMICQAGAIKDERLRPLLERKDLRVNPALAETLAGYDYSLNGNSSALDFILAALSKQKVGADAGEVCVLSFIDEWDRTTKAVNSHFLATDGAGGDCMNAFWARRQLLFPRNYLAFRGKAGDGAPLKDGDRVKSSNVTAAQVVKPEDAPATAMKEILLAARNRNGRVYAGGLSRSMKAEMIKEGKDPSKTFGDFGMVAFVEAKMVDDKTAEVVVEATDGTKRRLTLQMVLEDGAWKLTDQGL